MPDVPPDAVVSISAIQALASKYVPPVYSSPVSAAAGTSQNEWIDDDRLPAAIRAYLSTVPGAVSGQHGSDRTFYVAGRLIRGFDLTVEQALPFMLEWNQTCQPPWGEYELVRKLTDQAKVRGPRGFLRRAKSTPKRAKATAGSKQGHSNGGTGSSSDIESPEGTGQEGTPSAPPVAPKLANYRFEEVDSGKTTKLVRVGLSEGDIFETLVAHTEGWPKRVGDMLFARSLGGDDIRWIKHADDLFAWMSTQFAESGDRGMSWTGGDGMVSKKEFYAHCQTAAENYESAERFPHEPPIPTMYYMHQEVKGGSGEWLQGLLKRFSPATAVDEDLIRALFLTAFWGGPPGQRPLFVIEAEAGARNGGRGAGKSTIPDIVGMLTGGAISVTPNEEPGEIQRRLLGPTGRVKRLVMIDNVKSMKLSWAYVEGLITQAEISGRQMYQGESTRPNHLVWCVTFNQPSLSKDLSQRSVVIRLSTPAYNENWLEETRAYVEQYRWEIIGDCIAELRREVRLPDGYQTLRWGAWEGYVLAKAASNVEQAQALIKDRQAQVDDDESSALDAIEMIHSAIKDQFGFGVDPDEMVVLIPSEVIAEKVIKFIVSKPLDRSSAVKWLHGMGIPQIEKRDPKERRPYRGVIWRGPRARKDNLGMRTWGDVPE